MLNDILTSDWFWYVVGGFASNGFITQAVALTPTKKDDAAAKVIGSIFKTITGTHGLEKSS